MLIQLLNERLQAAGLPVVSVVDNGDGTYRADLATEATAQQQLQAAAIIAAFDPAAEGAAEAQASADRRGIITELTNEIDWLDGVIPQVDTMTAAQVRGLAKRLAQENRQIIRILVFLARWVEL